MKKHVYVMVCGIALSAIGVFGQDAAVKKELETSTAAPVVQEQLQQPDGVAIFSQPDGSFQIFGRGTGTYDFNDTDDINDARREAIMKAKANLAKFLKEKLSTVEGFEEAVKKVKALSKAGETQAATVSKETMKTMSQNIQSSSEALLRGVITLEERKIPRQGDSGEIQVTVGISTKTLAAAASVEGALNGVTEQEQVPAAPAAGANNKPEVRRTVTDF